MYPCKAEKRKASHCFSLANKNKTVAKCKICNLFVYLVKTALNQISLRDP